MNNGFDRDDLHAPNAEINTTPLVDVMLVLMVIFLVTAPVLEKATNVNLPKEQGIAVNDTKNNITIEITHDGVYLVNGEKIAENEIKPKLLEIKNQNKDVQIAIKADAKASHENVMKVVGMASRLGFNAINFISVDF